VNRIVLLLGLLLAGAGSGLAQDASTFIERARTGTAKYQDQSAAILDGYRRIGRDFPAMGEHWIRIDLLFDGRIEPERPEFLTYIVVSGTPKLLGAAYALPLLPGEQPPDLPAGNHAWHDHFNTIEDETLLPHHHHSGSVGDRARLAMLHAWIWSPNPDGTFAADNWAVPYLRLGVTPPINAPRSAALALSLLNGGDEYFAASIDASMSLDPEQRRAINSAFARARSAAAGTAATAMEPEQWNDIWEELVKSIEASVGRDVRAHLPANHD
jgi:hypothetical protein